MILKLKYLFLFIIVITHTECKRNKRQSLSGRVGDGNSFNYSII